MLGCRIGSRGSLHLAVSGNTGPRKRAAHRVSYLGAKHHRGEQCTLSDGNPLLWYCACTLRALEMGGPKMCHGDVLTLSSVCAQLRRFQRWTAQS
jgi:hypothetical protein